MRRGAPEYKSEGTTILLAVLFGFIGLWGMGHLYVGRLTRGFLFLFGGFIMEAIGFVLLFAALAGEPALILFEFLFMIIVFIIWIWHVVDAKEVCRRHNAEVAGVPPPYWSPPYSPM
jgi:hypothetical protein